MYCRELIFDACDRYPYWSELLFWIAFVVVVSVAIPATRRADAKKNTDPAVQKRRLTFAVMGALWILVSGGLANFAAYSFYRSTCEGLKQDRYPSLYGEVSSVKETPGRSPEIVCMGTKCFEITDTTDAMAFSKRADAGGLRVGDKVQVTYSEMDIFRIEGQCDVESVVEAAQ